MTTQRHHIKTAIGAFREDCFTRVVPHKLFANSRPLVIKVDGLGSERKALDESNARNRLFVRSKKFTGWRIAITSEKNM